MIVEKLLDSLLDEIADAEPKPENKRKLKLVDPLRAFPLGKIEKEDREADNRIGRMLTRKSWEGF